MLGGFNDWIMPNFINGVDAHAKELRTNGSPPLKLNQIKVAIFLSLELRHNLTIICWLEIPSNSKFWLKEMSAKEEVLCVELKRYPLLEE
jgi:hypothetical protein